MKSIKLLLLTSLLAVSTHAALITDSHSGSIETSINYSIPGEELTNDFFYATSLEYSASYDTETGIGSYSYTAYGPLGSLSISSSTTTGLYGWTQTSYYGEWWMPDFSNDFWFAIWFS